MEKGFALGLYSPEIQADSVEELFTRAKELGATAMQYNFLNSHGAELPARITREEAEEIGRLAAENGVRIAAVNGTFNMLEGEAALEEDLRRFRGLAGAMAALSCDSLTLCTGSFSPKGMWVLDERNQGQEAFDRAVRVTRQLLEIAQEYGLRLLVETEASNAICTVERTRRYLDALRSDRLKVILDCANLFPAGTARRENVRPTIARAFELLGEDIALAHGKDILEAPTPSFTAPGLGIVDYPFFFAQLRRAGYSGSLILHGIKHQEDLAPSMERMRSAMAPA